VKTPKRRGAPVVERVLEVTLEELARHGYHRLSIPEVADRAGFNKTSVYRRWPTKEALVAAALEGALGHDAPLPDTGALTSDMQAFVQGAVAWADSPVGRGVMKTLLADGSEPEVRSLLDGLLRRRASGPVLLFRRARERGELHPDADVPMALSVIAGAISHRLFVEDARASPAWVKRLVTLVARGLTAAEP
jgi:AcrR family transcriptional regulator